MNYSERHRVLSRLFELGKNTEESELNVRIRFFSFNSVFSKTEEKNGHNYFLKDKSIEENNDFVYPVFLPDSRKKYGEAILMLHGLNERSWHKYLTWADYLCRTTNKPIMLFPLAFHINRAPKIWSNPRAMMQIVELRRRRNGEDRWLSFANAALSERITERPLRFYHSGLQSYHDTVAILNEIKTGKHPLFKEDCKISIFAYSIGAFLSQILMMSNPENLFSDTKLFMFCGGSIFNSMYGCSKSIMDENAYQKMMHYYLNEFELKNCQNESKDIALRAFTSMISTDRNYKERTLTFENMGNNIAGIALEKDIVIPYKGINEALGSKLTEQNIKLMDFPFNYSHENPFPINEKTDRNELDEAFQRIFSDAANFLS